MSTKKNILLGVLLLSLLSIPVAPVAALPPPETLSIEQLDTVIGRIDEKVKQLKSKLKTEQVKVNVKGKAQVITYEALIRMLNQRTPEQRSNALRSVLQKNPNITNLLKSIRTLTNTEKSYKEQKTIKEEQKRREDEERKKKEEEERKNKENQPKDKTDISGTWQYTLLCRGDNPDKQTWTFTRRADGDYDFIGTSGLTGTASTQFDEDSGRMYVYLSWGKDGERKSNFRYTPNPNKNEPDTQTFSKYEGPGWDSRGAERDCPVTLIKDEPLKLSKAGGPPRIFGMYNMQDKPQANVLERIDPPVISNNNRGDNVPGKSGKFGSDSFICTGVEVIRPRDGASVIKPLSATISYSTPPKTIQPGVPVDLQLNLSGAPGVSAHGVWMASGLSPAGTVASVQSSYSLVEGKFDNEGNPLSWPPRGSSVFHSSAKVTWDGKGTAASLSVGCYCHGGSSTITWNYGFKPANGPIARNNPLLDKMIRQGTNLDDDISGTLFRGLPRNRRIPRKPITS